MGTNKEPVGGSAAADMPKPADLHYHHDADAGLSMDGGLIDDMQSVDGDARQHM